MLLLPSDERRAEVFGSNFVTEVMVDNMIKITSDSTCDLNRLTEERGIGIMPLNVILDTKVYRDGVDISPADIFAFVEKTKMLPKTSAPAIEDFS